MSLAPMFFDFSRTVLNYRFETALFDEVTSEATGRALRVSSEPLAVAEELPAAPPVDARGGTMKPDRITEDHCSEGDNAGYRVPE